MSGVRRTLRGGIALAAGLALTALLVAVVVGGWRPWAGPSSPFAGRALFVPPSSATLDAADQLAATQPEQAQALDAIGSTPQGVWLTPEALPPGRVGDRVAELSGQAAAADAVVLLVLYGLPDRDCSGGLSAGGLDAADYPGWVAEVAEAADPDHVAVVLEPDAVPQLITCGGAVDREERLGLLAGAVEALAEAEVPAYLDAGHSNWLPPEQVAPLLEQAGVASARGFSTNVSNYQPETDELTYAQRLRSALGEAGSGAHFVVDTGRNGAGATAGEDWCNPPGSALGRRPVAVEDGEGPAAGLDAYLWVKPPAESDGECAGGPPAGVVWPDRALALTRSGGG